MRTAALTTAIAAAALAAPACTSTQTGQASPPNSPGGASSASSSPSSGARNSLTGLNACSLVADGEAQQVAPGTETHIDQGEQGRAGTSNCQWTKVATNAAGTDGAVFSITVRPAQGLKDVTPKNGAQPSYTTSSAGRQVVTLKNAGSGNSCFAAIEVGSGRVDINATTSGGTTQQMCDLVNKIDDFVEPKLPAS